MEMAAMIETKEAQEKMQKILQMLESDPVTAKLMDAAETVEDMYEVAKRYSDITFDDFKQYFEEAMNLCEKKSDLPDEVMDCIAAGGFWGNVWDKLKRTALTVVFIMGVDVPREKLL